MTIQFHPENALLRECSFYVIAEIAHPGDDEPVRISTAATGFDNLIDAIGRALFNTAGDQRLESELLVLENIAKTLEVNDRWFFNSLSGAPMDVHVGFDDGDVQIIVRVFAIIDTLPGQMADPMTGTTVAPVSGADNLYMSIVGSAKDEGNISFIGHADPDTFRSIAWLTMGNDHATLLRLAPPGVQEGFLPDMTDRNGSTETRTVEFIYPSDGGMPLEAICAIWQTAGAQIVPADGGVNIRITAPVWELFELIDQTKAGFVGFKIVKE